MNKYIISELPKQKGVYYCHLKDYPNIPVFGSVGSYKKAKEFCKMYNAVKGMKANG